MTPLAFCERVSDLAAMKILKREDGLLIARRRLPEDRIVPTFQTGSYDDLWRHVRTMGQYVRHDDVLDMELDPIEGVPCYDYSSMTDGRLWLRAHASWHDVIDGRPRFEPICARAARSVQGG